MRRIVYPWSLAAVLACLLMGFVLPVRAMDQRPGIITGTVTFTGKVPEPKSILTTDGQTIVHNDLVVDAKTKGLRYVMVVLEDVPAQPDVKNAKPVVVDQREMIFVPRVVAVQQGQAVRFDNSDSCNHSVMGVSLIEANQFNIFVTASQPYERVLAPQKTPVQIGCSLHAWMRAWVYVVPHPWFSVTDAEGKFRIEGAPPGKYKLWLRHADTGHQERREVEVAGDKTTEVKVVWDKAGK